MGRPLGIYQTYSYVYIFIDVGEETKSRTGSPDEVPVVTISSNPEDNVCPICNEEFDQFYKQDFTDFTSTEGELGLNCK